MPVPYIAQPQQAQESDTAEAKPYGIRDSRPAGPGWFESSWELLAGLEVIEESDNGFSATL